MRDCGKGKFSREFAKNLRRNFRDFYARAADLLAIYYDLTPEKEILIAQIRGNLFYSYKKAVKKLDKYLKNYSIYDEIPTSMMNSILEGTDFDLYMKLS